MKLTIDLEDEWADSDCQNRVSEIIREAILNGVRAAVAKEMKVYDADLRAVAKRAVASVLKNSDAIQAMATKAALDAVKRANS